MTRVNKSWMAVVAAALLLGTLVGVVWARPNDRPGAAEVTRKVTLTGADFIPTQDDWDYSIGEYGSSDSSVSCLSSSCEFSAPVVFPCLPSVTVERIKLHVVDEVFMNQTWVWLYRANPSTGAVTSLGNLSSSYQGDPGLNTYTSGPINKVVWPSQKAYIHLDTYPNMQVYGVTVEYHRNI